VSRVLLDTGPLVALLSRRDHSHKICTETLRTLPTPLYTCWPVLTEAAWFLRSDMAAIEKLFTLGAAGFYRILPLDEADGLAMAEILKKYHRLKPQVADAALVQLAGREGIDTVFTLDRRDFQVYRPSPKRTFRLLPTLAH
jgi:predicted nucleic acid-binding protein